METPTHGHLADLPAAECWDLLATTEVGRLAWTTADGPIVVPVNFATDGRTIRVRTPGFSAIAQKVDAERVAFQVDRIDESTRAGWSVLARGRAEILYRKEPDSADPQPWPRGPRSATVVITVDEITGRRLEPEA